MSDIHFRMAAKTDVGLERSNNEDNFQVASNLEESPMKWVNNQEYSLGRKGALLVVADGMGGMNAGEVASDIAINTIRDVFRPENITDEVVKNRYSIEKFMKGAVVEADKRIKDFAKEHPESRGMGTTIVIGWLFDGNLYVTWCGDSRAYIFNPKTGLFQISKDHSYVQQLVDHGKISKEEAFDFPDSNIITRSLCDSAPKAQPDCLLKPQPLCNGDIILLCSDGLNGMIRDYEIEAVIAQHQNNMTECVDALIHAALDAAGADNCTVVLCQILSGGGESNQTRIPASCASSSSNAESTGDAGTKRLRMWGWISGIALFFICLIGGAWWYLQQRKPSSDIQIEVLDSTNQETIREDTIVTEGDEEPEPQVEEEQEDSDKVKNFMKELKKNRIAKNRNTGKRTDSLPGAINVNGIILTTSDVEESKAAEGTADEGASSSS